MKTGEVEEEEKEEEGVQTLSTFPKRMSNLKKVEIRQLVYS